MVVPTQVVNNAQQHYEQQAQPLICTGPNDVLYGVLIYSSGRPMATSLLPLIFGPFVPYVLNVGSANVSAWTWSSDFMRAEVSTHFSQLPTGQGQSRKFRELTNFTVPAPLLISHPAASAKVYSTPLRSTVSNSHLLCFI